MRVRTLLWVGAFVVGVTVPGLLETTAARADTGAGNVLISWTLPGVPSAGVTNIAFPITVEPSTVHNDGTYFADQFNFTNAKDVGYTGLQPRPDVNGHERLHAAFSSFIAGTASSDTNCSNGADGGAGVSCATEFDGTYGHTYDMVVALTGPDTWTGTAVDTVSELRHHVGTYTLPTGSGNLAGSQVGFVEYYLGVPSCNQMPQVNVIFGGPTSTDVGGLRGTSTADYEYNGNCLKHAGYQASRVGDGTHVIRGFITNGVHPSSAPSVPSPAHSTPSPDPATSAKASPAHSNASKPHESISVQLSPSMARDLAGSHSASAIPSYPNATTEPIATATSQASAYRGAFVIVLAMVIVICAALIVLIWTRRTRSQYTPKH